MPTKLTELESEFERTATTDHLKLFKFTQDNIAQEIPVIIEHALKYGDDRKISAEYFRARAMIPAYHRQEFERFLNAISVTVCHQSRTVRFGPTFRVDMAPCGIGLGSALMSEVIHWLQDEKQLDAYQIEPGNLGSGDADTDDDRLRRNHFYMKFGFQLSDYDGSQIGLDVVEGQFSQTSVEALAPNPSVGTELVSWRNDWAKRLTERQNAYFADLNRTARR